MARIVVVSSHPPFAEGGHLVLARALTRALVEAGHEAELVLTPQNRFGRQGAAYLATWLTDVGESEGRRIDRAISTRFPSYAIRHPQHVCWLYHTMREYYDLWPAFRARLSWRNRLKEGVRRRIVRAADRRFLTPPHLKKLFVLSRTVAERLQRAIGVEGEPLHPPPVARPYRCDGYGGFFLVVSRLAPHKRIDLAVRALAEPDGRGLQVAIAGDGPELDRLRALAQETGVHDRVMFLGRVDDATLVDLYARCRAVCFTPLGEDYGLVTTEAFASRKAVVTCVDSGGPAELVGHERNGLLCQPAPASVAAALRRLADDPSLAERLGAEAARTAATLTWAATIDRLLSA
jgi:glycosyltransferase involved in cell wall biosynthesis